ncbi:hypothetical protein BFG57_06545 [Bacillus solimangrovi]|uniref:Flagellar protein n=1 Tax=Bacillus solimangrovi TaxID=1305675 RepID=A0A1E5LB40_9BACI|nr:hypothetical protein BFG57_06545 [Bacillus solimangrovi]
MSILFVLTYTFSFTPHEQIVHAEKPSEGDTVEKWLMKEQVEPSEQQPVEEPDRNLQPENIEDPTAENETIPTFEQSVTWVDFVKLIFALAFIVGLIYFILRIVNQRNRMFGQARSLENLGGISLGNNRSVQLIRLGDRILVVGVGEDISLLKELSTKEETDELISLQQQIRPTSNDIISQVFKREKKTEADNQKQNFQSQLKKQLDDLAGGRKKIYESIKDEGRDK